MGSEAAAALDQLVIPQSRIKAIAKQEKDVAGLTQDALEAVGDATKALLKELVEGAASAARRRTKSTKGGRPGSVTIEPHDIREHILGTVRLSFLRNLAEQSKDSGFLEGYRSRAKAQGGGRKRKGVLAQVAGLGDLGESDDEGFVEEDADVAAPPESARAASSAPLKLDEDYDDEDDGGDEAPAKKTGPSLMPLTINVQPGPEELERTREVLHVLAKGGVAVANLEAKLAREDDNMRTREVLELAEEFGKVCAYVNHETMFAGLGMAWTCHLGRLLAVKKDMYRKLRVLEADQKADFNVVENLRRNRDLVERQIAEVNQRLTKLRLIKQQYDEERVAALQQAQDEEQRKMFQEMGLSM